MKASSGVFPSLRRAAPDGVTTVDGAGIPAGAAAADRARRERRPHRPGRAVILSERAARCNLPGGCAPLPRIGAGDMDVDVDGAIRRAVARPCHVSAQATWTWTGTAGRCNPPGGCVSSPRPAPVWGGQADAEAGPRLTRQGTVGDTVTRPAPTPECPCAAIGRCAHCRSILPSERQRKAGARQAGRGTDRQRATRSIASGPLASGRVRGGPREPPRAGRSGGGAHR